MGHELIEGKRVEIDRTDELDRFRYVCPNGHTTWERTNSHGWCAQCSEASAHDTDIEPEFYEIYDKKEDRHIPYELIKFEEDDE